MDAANLFPKTSQVWHNIGENLEAKWNGFLDIIGDDEEKLYVYGTAIVLIIVYWLFASFFTFMDITNRPRCFQKYKVQSGTHEPLDLQKFKSALKIVFINLTIVGIPVYYVFYHAFFKNRPNLPVRELPSVFTLILQIALFNVLGDVMVYYIHRVLHFPLVYKYIHKKHHEWTAPIAALAIYTHPVEHIFVNLVPVGVSLFLLRANLASSWIIYSLALINTMSDHAGYALPYFFSTIRFHDYHHTSFIYNFGVTGWLDKIHGTYRDPSEKQKTFSTSLPDDKIKSTKVFDKEN